MPYFHANFREAMVEKSISKWYSTVLTSAKLYSLCKDQFSLEAMGMSAAPVSSPVSVLYVSDRP